MSRAFRSAGILIILVVLAGVFWSFIDPADSEHEGPPSREDVSAHSHSDQQAEGRLISGSAFLEEYGDPNRSILNDLESVEALLTNCQLIFKNFDSYFIPDNQAVTSFLAGGNPEKIIWIPDSHPAINSEGNLMDRLGTPLFFHRLAGLRFEIYSAGEDRIMWTEDDVVFPASGGFPKSE